MTTGDMLSRRSVSFGDEQHPFTRFRAWLGAWPGDVVHSAPPSVEEQEEKLEAERSATATSRSVTLGPEAERTVSSDAISLEEMLKLKEIDLVQRLLKTNTFFHGKVGFYEKIIYRIYAADTADSSTDRPVIDPHTVKIEYIHTCRQLQEKQIGKQLILLPRERSNAALNLLISQSLLHEPEVPVWLIANPLAVHPHLLLGFRNFFIASDSEAEIRHLKDVLSLPEKTKDWLLSTTHRKAVFITDYEDAITQPDHLLAIVYLSDV